MFCGVLNQHTATCYFRFIKSYCTCQLLEFSGHMPKKISLDTNLIGKINFAVFNTALHTPTGDYTKILRKCAENASEMHKNGDVDMRDGHAGI